MDNLAWIQYITYYRLLYSNIFILLIRKVNALSASIKGFECSFIYVLKKRHTVCGYYMCYCLLRKFRLAEEHWIKINITRWIMKPRPHIWWNLAKGDIAWRRVIFQKKISTAQTLSAYGLPKILTCVVWTFVFTEYEIQTHIHLIWRCTCRCIFN